MDALTQASQLVKNYQKPTEMSRADWKKVPKDIVMLGIEIFENAVKRTKGCDPEMLEDFLILGISAAKQKTGFCKSCGQAVK